MILQTIMQIDALKAVTEAAEKVGAMPKWASDLISYGFWVGAIWQAKIVGLKWIEKRFEAKKEIAFEKGLSYERMAMIEKNERVFEKRLSLVERAVEAKLITSDEMRKFMADAKEDYDEIRELFQEFSATLFTASVHNFKVKKIQSDE